MRARIDVVDGAALDMHAADEHYVGPDEIAGTGGGHILVDEADFPVLRQCRSDHQKPLRRHEGARAAKAVSMFECAEGSRINRRNAEDFPLVTGGQTPADSPRSAHTPSPLLLVARSHARLITAEGAAMFRRRAGY